MPNSGPCGGVVVMVLSSAVQQIMRPARHYGLKRVPGRKAHGMICLKLLQWSVMVSYQSLKYWGENISP